MTIMVEILRPDDLLVLTIEGHNLRLDSSDPAAPVLVREAAAEDAFLVAVFPPQSFAEEAFEEVDPPDPPLPPPPPPPPRPPPGAVQARLSGGSRLAFRVPPGLAIPYTIAGLLDWSGLEPSLTAVGAIRGRPFILRRPPAVVPPSAQQTAIELPYRLAISPDPEGRWRHARDPVARGGRTELWHTRLAWAPPGEAPKELDAAATAPIRAVHSPDYRDAGPPPNTGFTMSLSAYDRRALVRLTGTFPRGAGLAGQLTDLGRPAEVVELALTSLGG
ncbi:hypothetical protein ACFW16_32065, partial [Inquilinus sp. NPDC058860]